MAFLNAVVMHLRMCSLYLCRVNYTISQAGSGAGSYRGKTPDIRRDTAYRTSDWLAGRAEDPPRPVSTALRSRLPLIRGQFSLLFGRRKVEQSILLFNSQLEGDPSISTEQI